MSGHGLEFVRIYDTTLRDGLQAPGISVAVEERVRLAEQIATLGVDVIEVANAAAGGVDIETAAVLAERLHDVTVSVATPVEHIDAAWRAVRRAARPRLHSAAFTSSVLMRHFGVNEGQILEQVPAAVARMRERCPEVEFSAGDCFRSSPDFVCEVLQSAVDNGATVVNLADTVGCAVPAEVASLVTTVLETVGGDYTVSLHCHDDLGLAVANSLAGVEAGARQVQCTVNGLGERAGNAALEEIAVALLIRPDRFEVATTLHTEEIAATSAMVAEITGYRVQRNKAVVGGNAFRQEYHREDVAADATTFQLIDAALVGAAVPSDG